MSLNTSHAFCHVFLNFNKSNDLVTLPGWERISLNLSHFSTSTWLTIILASISYNSNRTYLIRTFLLIFDGHEFSKVKEFVFCR